MNITYRGIELIIEGAYTEGTVGDYENLSYGDQYEVYEVYTPNGFENIIDLLSEEQLEELEKIVVDKLG